MTIDFGRLNGNQQLGRSTVPQNTEPNTSAQGGTQPAESKTVQGESVHLSQGARSLQNLSEQLKELPDTNQAKVQSLKQAITEGRYEVDSTRVADSMLRFEAQL